MVSKKDEKKTIGLCASCRHVRRVESSRGSTYYLCGLAAADPRFVKYPALPVLSCPGYEPEAPAEKPGDK